jgi:hypothetical protein
MSTRRTGPETASGTPAIITGFSFGLREMIVFVALVALVTALV